MESYIGLEINCSGYEITSFKDQASSAICRNEVDASLQRCGVKGLSVSLGSEIGGKVVLCASIDRNQRKRKD